MRVLTIVRTDAKNLVMLHMPLESDRSYDLSIHKFVYILGVTISMNFFPYMPRMTYKSKLIHKSIKNGRQKSYAQQHVLFFPINVSRILNLRFTIYNREESLTKLWRNHIFHHFYALEHTFNLCQPLTIV